MEAPRVLILCTWFPPVNAPGARRPYQLARCLVDQGWQVSVLTSTPESATAPYGALAGMRILRTPRTAATHDLNTPQRWLLRAVNGTKGSWLNGPIRVLADLLLPFRHSLRWDLSPARIEAEFGPQDIVVATSPDPSVFETGARLARHWNATWAVDYRDPWNVALPRVAKDIITHQGTGLAGALRRWHMARLERRWCGHAHLMTAVSKAFLANAQAVTGNRNGAVVHGGFDAGIRPGPRVQGEHFILAHTGQLYPEQPWDVFIRALVDLRHAEPELADSLRVRFIGPFSTNKQVMDELRRASILTNLIDTVPTLPPAEALAAQQDADELLQLALTGRQGYLPVKFLEYLGAARPILLLSNEQDEMEEALTATRTGDIVRSTREVVDHLTLRLRAHQARAPIPYSPDERALDLFRYDHNMRQWARHLAGARERHAAASSTTLK